MGKLSGTYVPFHKAEYSIPQIMEIIAKYYGFILPDKKISDKMYRAMTVRIRAELDKLRLISGDGPTVRNRKYPRDDVGKVINQTLARCFAKKAPEGQKALFEEWEKLAKDYEEEYEDGAYGAYLDSENQYMEDLRKNTTEADSVIYEMVQEHKIKILMDIVFNHLIELDEELLTQDLGISLTFLDNLPAGKEIGAMERLKNLPNYYKWRTKDRTDFFD